jgi:hypothetical protein
MGGPKYKINILPSFLRVMPIEETTYVDGPTLEPRYQEISRHARTSRPALGPTQPPLRRVLVFFLSSKAAGVSVDH